MTLEVDLLNGISAGRLLGPIKKRPISNPGVLSEAYDYAKPSSFSRGIRIDLDGLAVLLISGTASIDEQGRSVHVGDVRAQTRRTFLNIAGLLFTRAAGFDRYSGDSLPSGIADRNRSDCRRSGPIRALRVVCAMTPEASTFACHPVGSGLLACRRPFGRR